MTNSNRHPGTCIACGHRAGKAAMTRHLTSCVAVADEASTAVRRVASTIYHLHVEARSDPDHWLDVGVAADAPLEALDVFLRSTWLECCGHLSEFKVGDVHYRSMSMDDDFGGAQSMDVTLEQALVRAPRMPKKLLHVYDFGSSTLLELRIVRRYPAATRDAVRLLARNDPPTYLCSSCDAEATSYCTTCASPLYCKRHANKHGCDAEALLPVVDSPRMGVCGYTGPMPPAARGRRRQSKPRS